MRHTKPLLLLAALCGVGLAACGGTSTPAANGSTTTTTTAKGTSTTPTTLPGASGTLASISGDTLEVQNPTSGQVSVIVDSSTRISQTVTETAADVVTGVCVSATGTTAKSGVLTATSVEISTPTSSGCTFAGAGGLGGFGAGAGGFPARTGGTFPKRTTGSTFPATKRPAGSADFGSAFGKVTATAKSSFTVVGTKRSPTTPSSTTGSTTTSTTKSSTSTSTVSTTVDETSSTTYSKTITGTVSGLKVGECVTAIGTTNSIGAVTAKELSVRPAGASGCTTTDFGGAGGFRGGFGGFGGGGTPPATSAT